MSKAYEKAGVNIEAGYEAVERMKSHVERTARKGIMGTFGGFGGMFDLSALNYKEPVLISGTDGVGTKLKLHLWQISMIQSELTVWLCVSMISLHKVQSHYYFLDYVAVGKAVPEKYRTNC